MDERVGQGKKRQTRWAGAPRQSAVGEKRREEAQVHDFRHTPIGVCRLGCARASPCSEAAAPPLPLPRHDDPGRRPFQPALAGLRAKGHPPCANSGLNDANPHNASRPVAVWPRGHEQGAICRRTNVVRGQGGGWEREAPGGRRWSGHMMREGVGTAPSGAAKGQRRAGATGAGRAAPSALLADSQGGPRAAPVQRGTVGTRGINGRASTEALWAKGRPSAQAADGLWSRHIEGQGREHKTGGPSNAGARYVAGRREGGARPRVGRWRTGSQRSKGALHNTSSERGENTQ